MDRDPVERRRRLGRTGGPSIIAGAIIILFGTVLLLDNMGILDARSLWRFWPVALIAYGVSRIFHCRNKSSYIWFGVITLFGVLFLLENLHLYSVNFEHVWPLAIIAFGLSMLVRAFDRGRAPACSGASSASALNLNAVFGGGRRRMDTPDFQGGEVNAVFGGFQIDLRGASIPSGKASLEVNAVFGGVEIQVPQTWRIVTEGVGIFGGFEDKTIHSAAGDGASQPTLVITGSAVFGGVTVMN